MMFRYPIIGIALLSFILAVGCSGSGNGVAPTSGDLESQSNVDRHQCWGLWQFVADPDAGTLDVIQLRSGDFHLNALPFLEPPPLVNLTLESVQFNGNIVEADIGLRHPFLGLDEFTGFDVCGILITNGSMTGYGDSSLRLAGPGDTRLLNPDGVSRWWNPSEFPVNLGTMFSYNDGLLGTPDAVGHYNSTLNAYKYYCDDLGPNDPISNVTLAKRGLFSAGKKNIRHYSIELDAGLIFNYAVDACWHFPDGAKPWDIPGDFPEGANRTEPWRVDVTEALNTLWNDGNDSGGNLGLVLDVYDWFNSELDSVKIESPGNFPAVVSSTPTGGGDGYSTYEIDIFDVTPALDEINILISVTSEEDGFEGFIPGTNTTAYFSHVSDVASQPGEDPVCDIEIDPASPSMPFEGWGAFIFDASGSYDPLGNQLTFEWDFNDDGVFGDPYNYGPPEKPVKVFEFTNQTQVCVRVSNGVGGESECCVDVDIIGKPSKNIQLRPDVIPTDIAIDHTNGDLWVLYNDKVVWKYPRDNWYQSGAQLYPLWATIAHANWIDITPSQYSVIAGDYASNNPLTMIYDPSGNLLYPMAQGGPDYPNVEVYAITSGVYLNHVGNILGWPPDNATFAIRYPDDDWFYGNQWHYYWPTVYTGYDQIYFGYIKGVESDANGNYLWYLEGDPEYYAARWMLSTSGFPYSQNFDNAYMGIGSATDSDNGFNDPRDITRDDLDRIFVLDKLSTGEPRVKLWSVDGNNTTSLGSFGDSTTISADPLRIEGSDYEGNIVVLHGDASPYMISVFLPGEMPS